MLVVLGYLCLDVQYLDEIKIEVKNIYRISIHSLCFYSFKTKNINTLESHLNVLKKVNQKLRARALLTSEQGLKHRSKRFKGEKAVITLLKRTINLIGLQ